MNKRTKQYLLVLIIFCCYQAGAQDITRIFEPNYGDPFVIIIADEALIENLGDKITQTSNGKKAAYVLINGTNINAEIVKDSINNILNEKQRISKQFVYLTIAGSSDFFIKYNRFDKDFFANFHFLRTDEKAVDLGWFQSSDFSTLNISAFIEELNKTYRWPVFIDELQSKYVTYSFKNKGNFGMGFGTGPIFFSTRNTDKYAPSAINRFSLLFDKRLSKRVFLNTSINFGWKIPDPQEIVQDQLFGQLDIFALLDDDADPQELDLDFTIKGHGYANLNVEARYYYTKGNNFQPYVGSGISLTGLLGFNATIDTTIIIDPDSIDTSGGFAGFAGGGGPGGILDGSVDRDSLVGDFEPGIFSGIGIPISLGFQKRLGDRWVLDVNSRYTVDTATFSKTKQSLNSISISAGLSYRFMGKRKVYYDYIQLKD